MANSHRSGMFKRSSDGARVVIGTIMGVVFGFFIGMSFPSVSLNKINLPSSLISSLDVAITDIHGSTTSRSLEDNEPSNVPRIYVSTNPRGAELLPPGIIVSESDLYLRRLWGEPSEDLKKKPKYLMTFTVGLDQKNNIDAAVKKLSEDFMIMLFHYDDRVTEWDEFEWSKNAIHVSVRKQTKWWYAKRFLHPDIVAAYEYIFIWDEDLGVEHFNGNKYIELVKKHGLEISQPGLEPNNGLTWEMTKRRGDQEVHKEKFLVKIASLSDALSLSYQNLASHLWLLILMEYLDLDYKRSRLEMLLRCVGEAGMPLFYGAELQFEDI